MARSLPKAWRKKFHRDDKVPPLPPRAILDHLLHVAYHASFTVEEGRRTRFRFIYCDPAEVAEHRFPFFVEHDSTVLFTNARPFTVAEITRLAPATDPASVSIGVFATEANGPEIWGLLDSGASWWEFIHHDPTKRGGYPPPNYLTVQATEPGSLEISRAGDAVLSLRRGAIQTPQAGAFWDGPVADFLRPAQDALYAQACKALGRDKWDPDGADDDYPSRAYIFTLQRVLHYISSGGHGGAVVMVRDELSADDTRVTDRMVIKYPTHDTRLWALLLQDLEQHWKYFDLHFRLWDSTDPIDVEEFRDAVIADSNRDDVGYAMKDAARFVGSLSGVDGSIVLTDRFRLIGFGAEVYTTSPTLRTVTVTDSPDTGGSRKRPIEDYGTRHRAAFRFASSFEDAVVFVMSQDGGQKAVKRVGSEVVMWPDVGG